MMYERARSLIFDLPGMSDSQLLKVAAETGAFGVELWKVGGNKSVGEEALFVDFLTIVGSERGLWSDAGYVLPVVEPRAVDENYSRQCLELARELWREKKPLLVKLILNLKHGIRLIDDGSLLAISEIVNSTCLAEVRDEIFEWRLLTLRLALAAVLTDRKYRNV